MGLKLSDRSEIWQQCCRDACQIVERCDHSYTQYRGEIWWKLNILEPRGDDRPFSDIFVSIFFDENIWISIKISLKFVAKGPFDNKSVLVEIMAWCPTGDKPLLEPMMTQFSGAHLRHPAPMNKGVGLCQIILFNNLDFTKSLPEPTMRVYGARIKIYYVLCSKTYSTLSNLL